MHHFQNKSLAPCGRGNKYKTHTCMTELGEWCAKCSVQVNIYKCEIMHMRKKGVKRSEQKFVVNGEAVHNVTEYRSLSQA